MMRKPAVIVGLILIPLVTTSAVVVHLTNSSTGSGDVEHPALMSAPQQLDERSPASSSGAESGSAATTQSDVEDSTGTNNSKEPTPRSESSGGESEPASSEPTSEVMLAEITDEPSSYSLALLQQQSSSLDFPRTSPYGTRSGSVGLGAASASVGHAAGGASSSSGTASLADVKNTPVDSLPAQEQSADAAVEDNSDELLGEPRLASTNPTHSGGSNDPSIPQFPSEPQPEELLEDAPELVSGTGPTPSYSYDETWPKQYSPAPVQVPEPSSLMLLGLGLIGLAVASRKRA
jgi:PEP-CTERM motif